MSKNIVLLHGWGASTKKLDPLKKELEKYGWNVFVPKLPGFECDPPNEVWGLDQYAHYVKSESENYFGKSKYFAFGHSFGGGIVIKMAIESNVKGIILCATRGLSRSSIVKRTVFFVLAKVGKIFLLVPPIAKVWKTILYKLAREHDYEKTHGIMKEIFKKVVAESLKKSIKTIEKPILILWGEDDTMTPLRDALYINEYTANSKLITYPKVKHNIPYIKYRELAYEINSWI